ncbi:MAG: DUF4198 domain-containing protein [Woeseiaceae bacterium]
MSASKLLRATEDHDHCGRDLHFWPVCAGVLLGLLSVPAFAHDHFIWPERFSVVPGDKVQVTFHVGHGGDFDLWPHGVTKVLTMDWMSVASSESLLDAIGESDVSFVASTTGTHVLSMSSDFSDSALPPTKFANYVREEGLTAISDHRRLNGLEDTIGRERYSRRAKALVQVGDGRTNNVTQPVGLTLEITPQKNPYALVDGDALPLSVTFNGEPLAGAKVTLESLTILSFEEQALITDGKGEGEFSFPKSGAWKVNVVWGVPPADGELDYETVFSSLTFGF